MDADNKSWELARMENNRASIVFMLTSFDYGGAQTQVIALASGLINRGWNVKIISMLPPRAFLEKLDELDIEIATLDMQRGIPDPRAIVRLASILKEWKPTVFHCHMVHANLLGRVARLFTSVPVLISSAHNINEGGWVLETLYRVTDRLTDITTNVSHAAVDHFVQNKVVPKNRIKLMTNGIDTNCFLPNKALREEVRKQQGFGDDFIWIAIGRIEEAKDYENMVNAFHLLAQDYSARLIVLGDGPLKQDIQSKIDVLGLRDKVKLMGNRDDVKELLNASDGYVMSSAWEGLPIVLLEAASAEMPIVCTDVGGNREVVNNGQNGFVVSPANSIELSQAMSEIMDVSPFYRRQMGEVGRRHVEKNFSIEHVVDQWDGLYKDMLLSKNIELIKTTA